MSFSQAWGIYRSDGLGFVGGQAPSRGGPTPRLIVSMSFQPAIPWRVALQQSPPPLHQPRRSLQ